MYVLLHKLNSHVSTRNDPGVRQSVPAFPDNTHNHDPGVRQSVPAFPDNTHNHAIVEK